MNSKRTRWRTRYFVFFIITLPVLVVLGILNKQNQRRTVGLEVARGELVSIDQIDHREWDDLLKKFVDENGWVDYRAWSADAESKDQLNNYLKSLSCSDPRLPAKRVNRLAFWINAYNALTIHGILQQYPTSSIRNHTSNIGGYNIWYDLELIVGPKRFSLNAIEHQILRKMSDPRIHFAIVCASKSCPRLLNEAYRGERIDEQLTDNAKHFFANPDNFHLSKDEKTIFLSSILRWFFQDFGESEPELLQSIRPYLPAGAWNRMAEKHNIQYLDYDWQLNGI